MPEVEHSLLAPELFRQRRAEMRALADERRLALAVRPVRQGRARSRRRVPIGVVARVRLNPSPVPR